MNILLVFIIGIIAGSYGSSGSRQQIWKWWLEQAGVKKPYKCQANPQYLKPYPDKIQEIVKQEDQEKIFASRPCLQDEIQTFDWSFRGTVEEQKFEGPGKWKRSRSDQENSELVCIDKLDEVIEAVGNFQNGALEGYAKVVYESGNVDIGKFNNGTYGGFIRRFDPDGKLISYQFQENKHCKGNVWELVNDKYLLYETIQCLHNTFEYEQDDPTAVLIPFDENEDVMAGHYNHAIEALENVATVEIEQVIDEFCVPELKVKVGQKHDFFISMKTMAKIQPYQESQANCKAGLQDDLKTVEDQFNAWSRFHMNSVKTFDVVKSIVRVKSNEDSFKFNKTLVKQPFMSNVTLWPQGDLKVNMSIWNGPMTTWMVSSARLDEDLQFHGYNSIELDEQFWNHTGMHNFLKWSPKGIYGMFNHGKLQGHALVVTWKGQVLVASFQDGELHGFGFMIGTVPILDAEQRGALVHELPEGPTMGFGFIGHFYNGQVQGNFWAQMYQGGWLHGRADSNGNLSGDDIAYIYTDGETALKGHFENGVMKKAFNVNVEKYGCDDNGLLMVEKFSQPLSDTVYKYEPCTNVSFGFIDAPDPYELKNVKLANSSVPNSGQGVVLIKDLPKDRIACFYSLYLYFRPEQTDLYIGNCWHNSSKSVEYRRSCKKYSLNYHFYHLQIDLPPEFDINPLPNLGPKVNHHFGQNNSVYRETEHPLWGVIQTVTPMRDMKAGEELFTYYNYKEDLPFPQDHPWYFEAKTKFENEQRAKNNKKKSKKKKTKRNQ